MRIIDCHPRIDAHVNSLTGWTGWQDMDIIRRHYPVASRGQTVCAYCHRALMEIRDGKGWEGWIPSLTVIEWP